MPHHPRFTPPPDGTLCDVCGKRKVTGGTTIKYKGERISIDHCDECGFDLPIGNASWRQLGSDDPTSPRDPGATCDRCGAIGTVARVTRRLRTASVTRFCRMCWPAVRQEVEAEMKAKEDRLRSYFERMKENPTGSDELLDLRREEAVSCESRDWRDTLAFLDMISPSLEQELKAGSDWIVEQIMATESDMDGPMPPRVRAFIERYRPHT